MAAFDINVQMYILKIAHFLKNRRFFQKSYERQQSLSLNTTFKYVNVKHPTGQRSSGVRKTKHIYFLLATEYLVVFGHPVDNSGLF